MEKQLTAQGLLEHLNRLQSAGKNLSQLKVCVPVHSPGGLGQQPNVPVTSCAAGFDWDAGLLFMGPSEKLSSLTFEQVQDITASVRKGQSWHAYQQYKKRSEEIAALSEEVAALKKQLAVVIAAPKKRPGPAEIDQHQGATRCD